MKVSDRACPYCKSPSLGNPCWWFVDHPDLRETGADPPCSYAAEEQWDREARKARRLSRRVQRRKVIITVTVLIALALVIYLRYRFGG